MLQIKSVMTQKSISITQGFSFDFDFDFQFDIGIEVEFDLEFELLLRWYLLDPLTSTSFVDSY